MGRLRWWAVAVATVHVAGLVLCCGAVTLKLERAFPRIHDGLRVSELRARDRLRHRTRMMLSTDFNGVVDLPVEGTSDPFLVGLYFTRVQLGSPPKDFYVQIDTGSDILWVNCASCNGCPASSGLQIQLEFYDPSSSSTASLISCSDRQCALGDLSSDSVCSTQNHCSYTFRYGDGSGTSGYYVADLMHFDAVVDHALASNYSASVVFGCSTWQTRDLFKADRALDGIFGFGQQGLSLISQLSSQGIAPNVFSHCLKGSDEGGGKLVLGRIVEPNIVYTPLIPSQPHYNLNLQSIAVNGHILPISPSVFSTSDNRGTIIDSGTTLAYLAEDAFDPFVNAVTETVLQSVRPFASKGSQCYLVTSSISDIFPTVSLNFADGASMVLKPVDYLLQQNSIGGANVWCIGFQKIQGEGITILGDLVLKDKIVVYDLDGQRIGWTNYDCSLPVNVSTSTGAGKSEFLQINSAYQHDFYFLIKSFILSLLLQLSVFIGLPS